MAQIELITYDSGLVTPQYDALLHEASVLTNGVFFGAEVTASSSFNLYITKAIGMLQGREFVIPAQVIDVEREYTSGDTKGALYVEIDLDNTQKPIDIKAYIGSTPFVPQVNEDLNELDSGISQMVLATFTVAEQGIADVTQVVKTITKDDAIGTIGNASGTVSVKGEETKTGCELTLLAGTWLLVGRASFPASSASGYRWLKVTTNSSATNNSVNDTATEYATNGATLPEVTQIVNLSEQTTYYARVFQSYSGTTAVNVSTILRAVRIK